MDNFFKIYNSSVISFVDAEELLFVNITLSCKYLYNQTFSCSDTTHGDILAQGCMGIPGLLMMTADNPYETSKADVFDNELQVYLSNTFTSSILSQFETNPNSIIYDLYLHAFDKINGSHVMVYNPDYYGSLYLNDMSEYYPNR